jgi:hypothetical protein
MNYFVVTYTGKPIGESGESCSTDYILDGACKSCGTGAKLSGFLKTKKLNRVKKDFFQTVDGDYLISAKLNTKLVEKGFRIGNLNKVVDSKKNELSFYHLYTELDFPKTTNFNGLIIEGQCETCQRNGYFNDVEIGNLENNIPTRVIPIELIYSDLKLDFKNQSDIFNSWEHMGMSNREATGNLVIRYARPLLIVSEQLKFVLEEWLSNLKFDPIKID